MAKLPFEAIFIQHKDNSLEPRQRIRVGGVTFGPGVRFKRGCSFGGIDFTLFRGSDLQVKSDGDVLVIRGIYKKLPPKRKKPPTSTKETHLPDFFHFFTSFTGGPFW